MTCHCSSKEEHASRAVAYANDNARDKQSRLEAEVVTLRSQVAQRQGSTTNYNIERVEQVGAHLVVQARYPNCEHRAYEGLKTMVFRNVSALDALRWESIDPHFRGPNQTQQAMAKGHALLLGVHQREQTEAPSPAARFPGDAEGWSDAIAYARGKT